jgi:branched-chain amino acid transport system ATP-binding protein
MVQADATHDSQASTELVSLDNVEVVYDKNFLAVQGITMSVDQGDIVVLIGPNGAGKSTVLKSISGLGQMERAKVTRGQVHYDGGDVTNDRPIEMVNRGVTHILEGRRIFHDLTVEENLRCGLYRGGQRFRYDREDYELALEYFPHLKEILDLRAGYASGGEQQMLAIARGLIYQPELLMLDEPSLGLAPQLVEDMFDRIARINREQDITIIIADQNAKNTLEIGDYGYVIENGTIELHDEANELMEREEIKEYYLGQSGEGRDYSEIRHYKVRKRWT